MKKNTRRERIVQIFAMTHKKFERPKDTLYIPMQVGRKVHLDLGYLGDDTGDNISELNCYYAELTGAYWVWKNCKQIDYVGICHYRRYLLNKKGKMFTKSEILSVFEKDKYDLIATKKVILEHSYYDGFSGKHNEQDLIATEQVISEKYPEYLSTYQKLVHGNETYFGNMVITSKKLYDEYASWLFDIFFTLQTRIDPSQYDDYRMRVYGFISEFLLYVWTTYHKLCVLECDVAVIGEKKETQETKKQLTQLFATGDIEAAKIYFYDVYQKRPDILMEASDFDGTLKLAMQAIASSEYEKKMLGTSVLEETREFKKITEHYRWINAFVEHVKNQKDTEDEWIQLREKEISRPSIEISVKLVCKENQEKVLKQITDKLNMQCLH